jgi:beta-N-acetylhexosaminidase
MRAIYHSGPGIETGAVAALNAGADLILISWDPAQFYHVMYALLKAEQGGRLDREILLRSDERLGKAERGIRR